MDANLAVKEIQITLAGRKSSNFTLIREHSDRISVEQFITSTKERQSKQVKLNFKISEMISSFLKALYFEIKFEANNRLQLETENERKCFEISCLRNVVGDNCGHSFSLRSWCALLERLHRDYSKSYDSIVLLQTPAVSHALCLCFPSCAVRC